MDIQQLKDEYNKVADLSARSNAINSGLNNDG